MIVNVLQQVEFKTRVTSRCHSGLEDFFLVGGRCRSAVLPREQCATCYRIASHTFTSIQELLVVSALPSVMGEAGTSRVVGHEVVEVFKADVLSSPPSAEGLETIENPIWSLMESGQRLTVGFKRVDQFRVGSLWQ